MHPDDADFTFDTEAEADAGFARGLGAEHPERAWILSDRDCWYPNPYYRGPAVPHPEEYEPEHHGDYETYLAAFRARLALQAEAQVEASSEAPVVDDDFPF